MKEEGERVRSHAKHRHTSIEAIIKP